MSEKQYDDEMRGALFQTPKAELEANPSRPHFRGTQQIAGVKLRVSAWVRTVKNGKNAGSKLLSLSIEYPRDDDRVLVAQMKGLAPVNPEEAKADPMKEASDAFADDDLPF